MYSLKHIHSKNMFYMYNISIRYTNNCLPCMLLTKYVYILIVSFNEINLDKNVLVYGVHMHNATPIP